ncbi:Uncharacterised protein [Vibrio cholerae]|nr:Uncharacterised protein [Vibrio cholerae]
MAIMLSYGINLDQRLLLIAYVTPTKSRSLS